MEQQQESSSTILTKSHEGVLSSILRSGVDEITDIEKSMLETFARQTVSAIDSTRYIFPMIPAFFFDTAERGIVDFVMVQSSLLNFLAKETHDYADAIKQWSLESTEEGETSDRGAATLERGMDIALSGFEDEPHVTEPQVAELPKPTVGEERRGCGR